MFQDVKISNDLNMKFLDYLKLALLTTIQSPALTDLIGLDFNIRVLRVRKKNINFDMHE